MEFHNYLNLIADKLTQAQKNNDLEEYLRLCKLLKDTLEDTIRKIDNKKDSADIIYDIVGNPHEPGCPAIADDESDYEYLSDAGRCVCKYNNREQKEEETQ